MKPAAYDIPVFFKRNTRTLRAWSNPQSIHRCRKAKGLNGDEFGLDPEDLLVDVLRISELRKGESSFFLAAASCVKEGVTVFDSLHATYCGSSIIISSDRVFDRLGLDRIPLNEKDAA